MDMFAILRPPLLGAAALAIILVLSPLLLPSAVPGAGIARADGISLEERVRRIEDERDIRDLMVRYGQYLDSLDFAAYADLFARNGTWSGLLSGYAAISGPENIRAAMEKAFADRVYDPEHITNLHLISNIRIELDGDRAAGYSRWTVMTRGDGGEQSWPHEFRQFFVGG
jgi:uncharacterized protein (TIGR02246 family)